MLRTLEAVDMEREAGRDFAWARRGLLRAERQLSRVGGALPEVAAVDAVVTEILAPAACGYSLD